MSDQHDNRSVATLISDLAQQASTLVQTEVRLLKAEMSEKASKVGTGVAEMAAGAICLLAALIVLLFALVAALAETGMGPGWAALLVGVIVALLGVFLLKNGSTSFTNLTPDRTTEQLGQDARVVKEQLK